MSLGHDKVDKLSAGCVSYVDGTQDLRNFPINKGWSVEKCDMSMDEQLFNFSTRCQSNLSRISVESPCKLAKSLTDDKIDKIAREQVYTACRLVQCAGCEFWGSELSGLCKILRSSPHPDSVGKFAPKFKKLHDNVCRPQETDVLQTKHFVYSSYQSTITNLGKTLDALKSKDTGILIFKQLKPEDFEWRGKMLQLKPSSYLTPQQRQNAIVFVILKGKAEDKKKLKAAFGFVTPGGERFEGLRRSESVPLVQMMLVARETNQDLTFLRLQHIHIMEPNPTECA